MRRNNQTSILPLALAAAFFAACASNGGNQGTSDEQAGSGTQAHDTDESFKTLSATGLYKNGSIANPDKELADGVFEYTPNFKLWSDGAHKTRWIQLPPGKKIDTRDMDHWKFPVGTKVWKEFRDPDERRLETRFIMVLKDDDVFIATFLWNSTETSAKRVDDGYDRARGTLHDVPEQGVCMDCHGGEASSILGFSAIQLSRSGEGVTFNWLVNQNLITNSTNPALASEDGYTLPWDAQTNAALGYLHANCGHCHNPDGEADSHDQLLRIGISDLSKSAIKTAVFRSLNKEADHGPWGDNDEIENRLTPGDAAKSAIVYRMSQRGKPTRKPYDVPDDQMPPLGTEYVDMEGLRTVVAWIDALPSVPQTRE